MISFRTDKFAERGTQIQENKQSPLFLEACFPYRSKASKFIYVGGNKKWFNTEHVCFSLSQNLLLTDKRQTYHVCIS